MVNKGMFNLIRDVAEKRGLEFEEVLEVFGDSVAACSKKLEPGKNITIRVRFDVDKCEYYIEKLYKVVEELSEDQSEVEICEILLEDAKKIKRNAKVGEIIVEEVSNKDDRYSRVIVKSIGDTFNSNLINLERKKTYEYFKNYEHEMITATILKVQENMVFKKYIIESKYLYSEKNINNNQMNIIDTSVVNNDSYDEDDEDFNMLNN